MNFALKLRISLGCNNGSFGKNCIETCGSNCISCNAVNGVCDQGCSLGWKGTFCEHGKFSRDPQNEIASDIWFNSSKKKK